MNEDRFTDINTCHAFLNALTSGYSGKLRMLEILARLDSQIDYTKELTETRQILKDLEEWADLMWSGSPLCFRAQVEQLDDDARAVLWLADELKLETFERSERLEALLQDDLFEDSEEYAHELVGALVYQAAARESYVRGLVRYGEAFENDILEDKWERELASCEAQLKRAEGYFLRFQNSGAEDPALLHDLRESALLLPAIFRCQVHDLNQILGLCHSEKFTFDLAEFEQSEAEYWQEFGFDARAAGYWRAHDICPEEALMWVECGFTSPTAAGSWRYRGFSPDEAERWAVQGFNAIQAQFFASSGCDSPERASSVDEWSH